MLKRIKTLLEIKDDLQDDVLNEIISLTEAHFKALTGQDELIDHIIVEVCIKRFNRLGSEGYASKGIEGLSLSFNQNDFEEYLPILKRLYPNAFGKSGVKFI